MHVLSEKTRLIPFVNATAQIDARGASSTTALMAVADCGLTECVRFLLDCDADHYMGLVSIPNA